MASSEFRRSICRSGFPFPAGTTNGVKISAITTTGTLIRKTEPHQKRASRRPPITGPAAILAIVLGSALDPSGEPARLIAGAAAGGFFLLAAFISPRGMGMGDVKLAGVMGLLLGDAVAPALLIALVAGILGGLVVMARRSPGERHGVGVPFGPALALGGLVALSAGHAIIAAYLHLLG